MRTYSLQSLALFAILGVQLAAALPSTARVKRQGLVCYDSSKLSQDGTMCICPGTLKWDPIKNACPCGNPDKEYKKDAINGICQPCPAGSTNLGAACKCQWGFKWDQASNTCPELSCKDGSTMKADGSGCTCPAGLTWVMDTNSCPCPDTKTQYKKDATLGTCVACGPGGSPIQGGCKCPSSPWDSANNLCPGFVPTCTGRQWNKKGVCTDCPDLSIVNDDRTGCVCDNLQTFDSDKNSCPSKPLSCLPPQWINNGACSDCPGLSKPTEDKKGCVCLNGGSFDKTGNSCLCTPGTQWLNPSGQCDFCVSGSSTKDSGDGCVCTVGTWDPSNKCLEGCTETQFGVPGRCRDCPTGSQPKQDKSGCQCDNGAPWDEQLNACNASGGQTKCPKNAQLMPNGTCKCTNAAGAFYFNDGACKRCPQYSSDTSDGQTCVCGSPSADPSAVFSAAAGTCGCTGGLTWVKGACVGECGANMSRANNGACKCTDTTKYQVADDGNSCVPKCTKNAAWDGSKCACVAGWWMQADGTCAIGCPANASNKVSNTKACECVPGYIWDSTKTSCNACPKNSEWVSTNLCSCKGKFTWVGAECVPVVCPTNAEQTEKGKCTCKGIFHWKDETTQDECILTVCVKNAQLQDNGKCTCNGRYTWSGTDCVLITCAKNAVLQNTGKCTCTGQYQWSTIDPTLCEKKTCPVLNSSLNDAGNCVCDSNYKWDDTKTNCIPKGTKGGGSTTPPGGGTTPPGGGTTTGGSGNTTGGTSPGNGTPGNTNPGGNNPGNTDQGTGTGSGSGSGGNTTPENNASGNTTPGGGDTGSNAPGAGSTNPGGNTSPGGGTNTSGKRMRRRSQPQWRR